MDMREKQARRRLILILTLGYAGYYLCRSNFSVTLPLLIQYLEETGLSETDASVALGTVASAGVLAYAGGKFLSGPFNDRFGGRTGFIGGMAGSGFFTVLFALAGGLPLFSLAWIGNRLVQSGGWVGMVQICSRWLPAASYASAMAVVSQSFLFGDAAVRVGLGSLMAFGAGWRTVFLASAILLLCLCLWVSRELHGAPAEKNLPEPPPASIAGLALVSNCLCSVFRADAAPGNLQYLDASLFCAGRRYGSGRGGALECGVSFFRRGECSGRGRCRRSRGSLGAYDRDLDCLPGIGRRPLCTLRFAGTSSTRGCGSVGFVGRGDHSGGVCVSGRGDRNRSGRQGRQRYGQWSDRWLWLSGRHSGWSGDCGPGD